jgi:hypothetical protein
MVEENIVTVPDFVPGEGFSIELVDGEQKPIAKARLKASLDGAPAKPVKSVDARRPDVISQCHEHLLECLYQLFFIRSPIVHIPFILISRGAVALDRIGRRYVAKLYCG